MSEERRLKTLEQCLKQYEFTDFEDEEPIVYDMFHKDDINKAVKEWLTQYQNERTRESERSEGAWLQLEELLKEFAEVLFISHEQMEVKK